MKFKVGDKVIVNDCNHRNVKAVIDMVDKDVTPYRCTINGCVVWFRADEVSARKPKEKQSDKIRRIVREEMKAHEKKKAEELCDRWKILDTGWKDKFICSDDPPKPKSGWYKDIIPENKEWMMYRDFENNKCFGFNTFGEWREFNNQFNLDDTETPATTSEVIERLVDYIKTKEG